MKKPENKIYVVFGLHAYQPPTQFPFITEQINKESYISVAKTLLDSPAETIICADIALSLLEQLEATHCQETIQLFRKCVETGKIHLVNTAAYHPILPLVPEYFIRRQLAKNLAGYKRYFGVNPSDVHGLFPPEMAFSERIIVPAKDSGASWIITDDVPFCTHYCNTPPHNQIIRNKNTYVLLMSHTWHKIAAFGEIEDGKRFLDALHYGVRRWIGDSPAYIILWMDWETFGHHDKKPRPPQDRVNNFLIPFFKEIAKSNLFKLSTPDELITLFPSMENVFVPDGSWSTSSEHYLQNIAWPLWLHPHQKFHSLWWQLTNYTLSVFGSTENKEIENLVDRALYSCQPWQWANGNGEIAKRGLEIFRQIFEHDSTSESIKKYGLSLIDQIQKT